ncbi:hypothetical protein BCV69DRAFT_298564 [Microstroma glucosiphilum]|uniref:HNH nuclease domain-containing protein n=1 Tax=Pseudomicrostroma glucosiphilum TaxID=1684307 RepID=A0A316U9P3_9BASI|nr:hypothetical protein BCV69DRAFT_298564 [Pseudomicrostroma glucosiphilum]PWN21558.1 hypothetical protein BCV69DRAFT_298564 [Pseudomicrostroma glucosiphilum]
MPKGNFLVLRRSDLSPLMAAQTTHQYFDRSGILRTLGAMSAELDTNFARRVRQRDTACCITGRTKAACGDDWMTFAAVHIFPPEYIAMWKAEGAGDLVEDDGPGQGEARIDSVQNGLLMQWTEAVHWELHNITVDVDDDYAIIDFTQSGEYAGRRLIMDRSVEGKLQPLDALLQGHYLQSILANLRGPGKGVPASMTLAEGQH